MTETGRWRDGKLGLVHQLQPWTQKVTVQPELFSGTRGTVYVEVASKVTAVLWLPLCGIHRKKNQRVGKHAGPLTCLSCIGRLGT